MLGISQFSHLTPRAHTLCHYAILYKYSGIHIFGLNNKENYWCMTEVQMQGRLHSWLGSSSVSCDSLGSVLFHVQLHPQADCDSWSNFSHTKTSSRRETGFLLQETLLKGQRTFPDTPTKFSKSSLAPNGAYAHSCINGGQGVMVLNKSYEPPLDLEIVSASLGTWAVKKLIRTLNREVQFSSDTENLK